MFDTHCHLNFKRLQKDLEKIIRQARDRGVRRILVPGTDVASSRVAVEIANRYEEVYAAVGIHPHHAYEILEKKLDVSSVILEIKDLLNRRKVVAVGEVGLDRHQYSETKYDDYKIGDEFLNLQKELFRLQVGLAAEFDLSLIIHNREAEVEMLEILTECWSESLRGRVVFHCCEPSFNLLKYATDHDIYVGVDGDVTYDPVKAAFIKEVPLERLVLETDSPYLLPEPLRTQRKFPNVPENLELIARKVSELKESHWEEVGRFCGDNGRELFGI